MANFVRRSAHRAELPLSGEAYPLSEPGSKLEEGLAAWQDLRLNLELQTLPLAQRREVTGFLRRLGRLLHRSLLPPEGWQRIDTARPLLLALEPPWVAYPWELLHDGSRWLALHGGVVRCPARPVESAPPAAPGGALRALLVSADPPGGDPEGPVTRQRAALDPRFLSPVTELLDSGDEAEGMVCRAEDHAGPAELERTLALEPHLLHFSGYAGQHGWALEHGADSRSTGWEWLATELGRATRSGLRLVVLNDAAGLLEPETGAEHGNLLLKAGVPAVVRTGGRLARLREQEYMRVLARQSQGGASAMGAHLAGLRRLHRRHEDGWDWAFLQLHQRHWPPAEGAAPARERRAAPPPLTHAERAFESRPAPPAFSMRRRCLVRHEDLQRLLEALVPAESPEAPLVFLSGPAGSGKTVLALEAARRLRRRFERVVYLHDRDLLPALEADAESEAPWLETVRTCLPPPGLLAELGRHLQVPPPPDAAQWPERLREHCADGVPRLIVVDRLEHHPDHETLCATLAALPATCRVLLLSRDDMPLLRGPRLALEPVAPDVLARLYGEALLERLREAEAPGLLDWCRTDLLGARLLRRLPDWPTRAEVQAGHTADGAPNPRAILRTVVDRALDALSGPARETLTALVLMPGLVHRDVAAELCEHGPRALQDALTELQWFGLVDAFDGERYLAAHPRVHGRAAERLLNGGAVLRLQGRLVRAYQTWLTGLNGWPGAFRSHWGQQPLPLTCWAERQLGSQPPAFARALHRLGVERGNLAEVAVLLAEAGEWRQLERVVQATAPLQDLPGLGDWCALLHRLLLEAGLRREQPAVQATALNRLAHLLLSAGHASAAEHLLEHALHLLSNSRAWEPLGEAYRMLARCYANGGRPDAAANLLHAAAELAGQTGDNAALLAACRALHAVWVGTGEALDRGPAFLAPHIERLRRGGDALRAVLLERLLADGARAAGRLAEAVEGYEAVLTECERLDAAQEAAVTRMRLADCARRTGDADAAWQAWELAWRGGGGGQWADEAPAPVLREICHLFEQRGETRKALDGYLRLREALSGAGDRDALVAVLDRIGRLYYQLGEQGESTRYYEERLQLEAAGSPA